MRSSGKLLRRARGLMLTCALVYVSLSTGCGVPDLVDFRYEEVPPECVTVADCKDDQDACTADACVENKCVHTSVSPDDKNVCTDDACDPVTGVSNTPVSFDDKTVCTIDACDPVTGPSHIPVNIDDGNACTIDACDPVTGVSNILVSVDDMDACTMDSCDPVTGMIDHPRVNSDDNNVCTDDACDSTTGLVTHAFINIDDSNGCTLDECDSVSGISHTPNVICMQQIAEDCGFKLCEPASGACVYAPQAFSEDFTDNTQGWMLDMQWEIGSASSSAGHQFGFADPDEDYDGAMFAGNGVAGVNIGGNASTTGGSTYFLTSPEVDLSSLPANETVFLDLWRWLNTSAPATMKSNIEVWNGSTWVQVWTNNGVLYDGAWNNVAYNVTAHKNAHFRVRFGLTVMAGAPAMSSWNIDHVRLIRFIDQGC